MLSIMLFGLIVGAGHTLEVDHMAAVAALVSGKTNRRVIIRHGAIWGLGHAAILLLVGGTALLLKSSLPGHFADGLEMLVGVMLIGLGAHVVHGLRRVDANPGTHTHSRATDRPVPFRQGDGLMMAGAAGHVQAWSDTAELRTLLVGFMHGLAGSSALILASAATLDTPAQGVAYIAVFGVGSILGMAAVSALMSLVLIPARSLTRVHNGLQLAIGCLTIMAGIVVLVTSGLGVSA